jgi:hypothetical protein
MGGSLDALFRSLSITPHLPIVGLEAPALEERKSAPESTPGAPMTPKAEDSCDRLRRRLKTIETALADTSTLFRNKH